MYIPQDESVTRPARRRRRLRKSMTAALRVPIALSAIAAGSGVSVQAIAAVRKAVDTSAQPAPASSCHSRVEYAGRSSGSSAQRPGRVPPPPGGTHDRGLTEQAHKARRDWEPRSRIGAPSHDRPKHHCTT